MQKIGRFKQEGRLYRGTISTLHLQFDAVMAPKARGFGVPLTDYSITVASPHGFANEIGIARLHQYYTGEDNIPYFTVEIDDPSCPSPIHGILWRNLDGYHYLHWDRGMVGKAGAETLYMQEEMKPPLGVGRTPTKLTEYVRELCPNLQL